MSGASRGASPRVVSGPGSQDRSYFPLMLINEYTDTMTNQDENSQTDHLDTGVPLDDFDEVQELFDMAFAKGLEALASTLATRGLSVDIETLRETSSAWARDAEGSKVSLVVTDRLRIAEIPLELARTAGITLTAPGLPIVLLTTTQSEEVPDEEAAQVAIDQAAAKEGAVLVVRSEDQKLALLAHQKEHLYLPLALLRYPGVVAAVPDGEMFRATNDPEEGARLAEEKLGAPGREGS